MHVQPLALRNLDYVQALALRDLESRATAGTIFVRPSARHSEIRESRSGPERAPQGQKRAAETAEELFLASGCAEAEPEQERRQTRT